MSGNLKALSADAIMSNINWMQSCSRFSLLRFLKFKNELPLKFSDNFSSGEFFAPLIFLRDS